MQEHTAVERRAPYYTPKPAVFSAPVRRHLAELAEGET